MSCDSTQFAIADGVPGTFAKPSQNCFIPAIVLV